MDVFNAAALQGKAALCVGGTSGIGFAIARRFAELGASVYVVSRSAEKVSTAIAGIGAHRADGSTADVRDFGAVSAAAANCMDRFGAIDIVVSGAAGNFLCTAADLSPKGFRTVIDIDLVGGFHVMKAVYPHLTRPGASIINISALQAFLAMPLQAHAAAATAGLDALVRALAMEWGPEGIRINSIAPGAVSGTEGMRRLAPAETSASGALIEGTPLRRCAEPDDIANLAVFLAATASKNITGAVMVSDGGYSIR